MFVVCDYSRASQPTWCAPCRTSRSDSASDALRAPTITSQAQCSSDTACRTSESTDATPTDDESRHDFVITGSPRAQEQRDREWSDQESVGDDDADTEVYHDADETEMDPPVNDRLKVQAASDKRSLSFDVPKDENPGRGSVRRSKRPKAPTSTIAKRRATPLHDQQVKKNKIHNDTNAQEAGALPGSIQSLSETIIDM